MNRSRRTDAVIVDAVRSPVARGKMGGALSGVHPVDLLAQTLQAIVARNNLDPGTVDDVLIGCVSQVGEQSATPGRMAWLGAGFPAHVPSATIDRKCGSSQQTVSFAAQSVMAGVNEIVIAGGVESMSRVPMGSARQSADPYGSMVADRFSPGLLSQGMAAELVAERWGISREELDELALLSHQRAGAADFAREIVAIDTPEGRLSADSTVRANSSRESLAKLDPSFHSDALARRFPQIEWSITAGNSSQLADGAATLLIMSLEKAEALGLRPRARIHTMTVCGDDPMMMLTAPIPATHKALERSGLSLGDIAHFEVNEAFASVPLAWMKEFGVDAERVNPRGGAIALGHPLGASGARIMTSMLHALEDNDQQFGLQVMCEAGGMANATIIERI